MIVFPTTVEDAAGQRGEYRAGGTDLHERRRLGISEGPIVELRDVAGLGEIEIGRDGSVSIGARVPIARIAAAPEVVAGYPGLAEAAGGLATPQIRAVGTLGGNLLQRTRCWYYRSPEAKCLKKGGDRCYARDGDHLYHACFDLGPCVSVHPSTLGMALLAYDARAAIVGESDRSIADLYGDGSDPQRDHALSDGALLRHVILPAPADGERSAYFRAIARARSEWPLVEVLARVFVDGDRVTRAAVAVGGVAPRPLRLPEVESALAGASTTEDGLRAACKAASSEASPLPMTGYKVELLERTVLETVERAVARAPVKPPAAKRHKLPTAADATTKEEAKP